MNKLSATILIVTTSLTIKAQNIQNFADSLMLKNGIPEIGFAVITADTILDLQTLGFNRTDIIRAINLNRESNLPNIY